MKRKLLIFAFLISMPFVRLYSQDEQDEGDSGLKITGSVDTYYKYDFSGESQIFTSFASDHNTFGIGMLDLSLSKTVGKASFVGEAAFGPRASASAPGPVQNLYVTYQFSDMFSLTGGFMGTFLGYEVISPVPNFNYSMSYLFTFGPFQNAGLKANFKFSDNAGFMVGLFNQFDSYTNVGNSLGLGSQIYVMPVDGLNIYLNFVSHEYSGTEIDLTSTFQATDQLKLGLNVAKRSIKYFGADIFDTGGYGIPFFGAAGYVNYQLSDPVAVGLRYEYFNDSDGYITGFLPDGTSINAVTLSGNITAGPIRLIPEIRFDMGSEDIFRNANGEPVGSAAQALVAAVFAF